MAGLYGRVSGRGFPSRVAQGMTGEGALESQGGPTDPAHGVNTTPVGRYTTTLGFAPEAPDAPPQVPLLPSAFGLHGGVNEDRTPTGHAGPVPGWAGSYAPSAELDAMHANSAEIHGADFGALGPRIAVHGAPVEPAYSVEGPYEYIGDNNLQPLRGQIQAMGGYDRDQGYSLSNRFGFDGGHRQRIVDSQPQPMYYLDPGERVQIWPQGSGNFTPSDAPQGPGQWASGWDARAVNATPPSSYQPPAEPATLTQPLQGAPVSAGWFS